MKWWRYGDPLVPDRPRSGNPTRTPLDKRLDDRWVVDASGCWLWRGDKRNGYGSVWVDGRRQYAHRAIYELLVGPIALGAVIRHSCDTPACVNPEHLLVGTQADNMADVSNRGRWRNQHAVGPNAAHLRVVS